MKEVAKKKRKKVCRVGVVVAAIFENNLPQAQIHNKNSY
jgi:hypothetical protein